MRRASNMRVHLIQNPCSAASKIRELQSGKPVLSGSAKSSLPTLTSLTIVRAVRFVGDEGHCMRTRGWFWPWTGSAPLFNVLRAIVSRACN
jgi:hypothetical protein